jgi:hypothetical protein
MQEDKARPDGKASRVNQLECTKGYGHVIRDRSETAKLNPGVCSRLTDLGILAELTVWPPKA